MQNMPPRKMLCITPMQRFVVLGVIVMGNVQKGNSGDASLLQSAMCLERMILQFS